MLSRTLRIYFVVFTVYFAMVIDVDAVQLKKTIAVSRFEDGASSGLVGQGMSDQLSDALVASGNFIVLDRRTMYDITSEQDLATGNRAAASETARKGRILPAQILIRGTITEFGADKRTGGTGINVGGVSFGSNKVVGHVGLIIQLIDTTSGQITDSFRVAVEVKDKGKKMNVKYGLIDFNKEEFKKTPLGQATQTAINTAVDEITKRMSRIPFEGRIIKVEGDTIYTNVGSRTGLDELSQLEAFQTGEQLIDPVTGENLGSEAVKVGRLKITSIEEKFSKGTGESGGPFKVGMILKETAIQQTQALNANRLPESAQ